MVKKNNKNKGSKKINEKRNVVAQRIIKQKKVVKE